MADAVRKHIVVSAVNLRKGGTLTVLRDCLRYLSGKEDWQVTALVHDRSLCDCPGIRYIEIPWSVKGWLRRLWCEYVTMHRISRKLPHVDLWFSLHDTTPRVKADRQAVYCHTSFPFLQPIWQDVRMDCKIPMFSLFTRYAYRINVRRNKYLVVQAEWMRQGLSRMIHFPKERIILAPPSFHMPEVTDTSMESPVPVFLYPSTPDCHKNFETACKAAQMLEHRLGQGRFKLVITVSGAENKYARWLKGQYGEVKSIDFHGLMGWEEMYAAYGQASCLVFASRVETWGLPISEFLPTGKPMLLAELPYAHETAAGAAGAAFFPCRDAEALALMMEYVLRGDLACFGPVSELQTARPSARGWEELFNLLLS